MHVLDLQQHLGHLTTAHTYITWAESTRTAQLSSDQNAKLWANKLLFVIEYVLGSWFGGNNNRHKTSARSGLQTYVDSE